MLRVHVGFSPEPDDRALLEELAGDAVRLSYGPERPAPVDHEVLVAGRPSGEDLAAPALRALVIPYAGVPAATRERVVAADALAVYNLHHNAAPTAELAVALLLAAGKRLLPLDRALRAGDWTPRYEPPEAITLAGRSAVVLGHGAVGRRVSAALTGLGMSVTAVRRRPGTSSTVPEHPPAELPRLLKTASALIVTLPLTPATEGIVGSAELAALPVGAILVNVGRGPIVDEEALYLALAAGNLGAAGLDVWYTYPEAEKERSATQPSRLPLHELDNVVMSPHRGGQTRDTERLRMTHLAEVLTALARGDEPASRVDVAAGY